MKKVSSIITPQTIALIIHIDNNFHNIQINKDDEKYSKLVELLKSKDEEGVINLVFEKKQKFEHFTKGSFKVSNNNEIYHEETKTYISKFLSNRILEWESQNLPFEPLLEFHKKVIQNPESESIVDLYEFLEKNRIVLCDDGCFIGYKKVTTVNGKLMDSYTKTIENKVGSIVRIPRSKCNNDRNVTCAEGLHIGAFSYVNKFQGDTIILCKVNPKNVVSVPKDYNSQKMRVCEYEVLGIYKADNELNVNYAKNIINVDKDNDEIKHNKIIKQFIFSLPDYASLTVSEWIEWAASNLGLIITTSVDKKDRVYKKILSYIN